jgi:hypothetical protein
LRFLRVEKEIEGRAFQGNMTENGKGAGGWTRVIPFLIVWVWILIGATCNDDVVAMNRGAGGTGGAPLGPGPLPDAPALTFHVAPTGDDTNPGTAAAPFATLAKARDAVRARRVSGTLGAGPVVVQVHKGIYRVTETLVLGKEDSGSEGAPVVWTAAPGATVRLVGGVQLTNWRPVRDPAIRDRLAAAARANVVEADLSALGVTDFGTVEPGDARAEIFFNGKYLTLERKRGQAHLAACLAVRALVSPGPGGRNDQRNKAEEHHEN